MGSVGQNSKDGVNSVVLVVVVVVDEVVDVAVVVVVVVVVLDFVVDFGVSVVLTQVVDTNGSVTVVVPSSSISQVGRVGAGGGGLVARLRMLTDFP